MKMDKSTFFTMEDIEKDWSDTFVISTAIRELDEYIKELEQIKFKYEFGKHFDQIHSFLF